VSVSDQKDEEQGGEAESQSGDGGGDDDGINDPLTRTNVDAPSAPFGADPESESDE
jgi:hypothetical protein